MKKIFSSLPVKLLIGIVIGIIFGQIFPENVMSVVVPLKNILGQVINFVVPLIVIGFIAPSITKLGNNASRMLGVALMVAYTSSVLAALLSMGAGYAIIPNLPVVSEIEGLKELPEDVFGLTIPQIKVLREDMVDFGVPLFANIHLCGSVLTEVFFCMIVSKVLYGTLPDIQTLVLFCVLLAIFAIGAPGVPGGTVMASLGLITGVLGFGDDGTALMLAIFALQDSFGTACNVTGDGALTLFLTGYAEKHGIEKQNISVEL